jgi:hypothetical protein
MEPRRQVTFEVKLTYPSEIETGYGFQIVLESRVSSVADIGPVASSHTTVVALPESLRSAYHVFQLELPGLEVSPTEPNRLGIDEKVRWQIAPVRNPGNYVGYIRPKPGTAAVMGAEYVIKWKNPGDLELRIRVKRSFAILDKVGSLAFGLLGSILSFPALLTIYRALSAKALPKE